MQFFFFYLIPLWPCHQQQMEETITTTPQCAWYMCQAWIKFTSQLPSSLSSQPSSNSEVVWFWETRWFDQRHAAWSCKRKNEGIDQRQMVRKWYISWLLHREHNFSLQVYTTHNNFMEHACPEAATKQRQFIALAGDSCSPHLCTLREDCEERLQALQILGLLVLELRKMTMVLLRRVGLEMSVRHWRCSFDTGTCHESLLANLNLILETHVKVEWKNLEKNALWPSHMCCS